VVPCRTHLHVDVDTDPLSADDTLEDIDPAWAENVDLDAIDAAASKNQ
jgi:hypothetical protein